MWTAKLFPVNRESQKCITGIANACARCHQQCTLRDGLPALVDRSAIRAAAIDGVETAAGIEVTFPLTGSMDAV